MPLPDDLPHAFTIALPAWVDEELAGVPAVLATREDRVALVHRLARRNFREGDGGPFAALVVDSDSGELVSVGVNVVLSAQNSSAHAEVVALGLAQAGAGSWDLGADGARRELVVNWRPCAQCCGSTLWSGVRTLVVAGSGPELEEITGFDEGPVRDDWAEQFEARGVSVVSDVLREQALDVFRAYAAHVEATGAVVYNARTD